MIELYFNKILKMEMVVSLTIQKKSHVWTSLIFSTCIVKFGCMAHETYIVTAEEIISNTF